MRNEKTRNMVMCAMFVALIAAGAFIKIPIPAVPFTLQYLFTMLSGLLLGGKRGCLSVCIYILLGLAGLPIFAMTADAFSEDIQRSREAGMNEHIAKPIDVDRLMMLLKKYLKKA